MSWIDTLVFGYRIIQIGGVSLAVRNVVNLIGVSGVDNPQFDRTDVTITGTNGLTQQVVTSGQTVNPGSKAWIDTSGGAVPFNAPTIGPGVRFGAVDAHKGGSFSPTNVASLANPLGIIEDPGASGVFTNNPVLLLTPTQDAEWQADPTGAFYKVQ